MEVACQSLLVDNRDSRRGRKVEFRLGEGQVLFPGAEPELRRDIPCFSNHHPDKMRLRIRLKENVVERIAGGIGLEPRHTPEERVPRS